MTRYEYDGLIYDVMHKRGCFHIPPEESEDIAQELRLVVEKCKKKYDSSCGAAFTTYATKAIHNRITRLKERHVRHPTVALFSQIDNNPEKNVEDEIVNETYDVDVVVARSLLAERIRTDLQKVEFEILRLLLLGYSLRQVAKRVHLDRQTVWLKSKKAKLRLKASS